MNKPKEKAAAGWYDAPVDEGLEQYWNGNSWTKQRRPIGSDLEFKEPGQVISSISSGFYKVFDFKGKASRSEYWYFQLFSAISNFLIGFLGAPIFGDGNISILWTLSLLLCTLSLSVRRMHDVGKSGWFILVPLYSFFLTLQPSNKIEK